MKCSESVGLCAHTVLYKLVNFAPFLFVNKDTPFIHKHGAHLFPINLFALGMFQTDDF